MLDEAVRFGLLGRPLALDVAARVERELGLRALDLQRAARLAPALERGRRRAGGRERLGPRLLRRLGDPVRVRVRSIDAPRGRVDLDPAFDPTG